MSGKTQRWFLWGLPILLAASVLAGMAIERPQAAAAAPAADEEPKDAADKLPRFDCEDRSVGPYEADPQMQQRHLDWMSENLDLDRGQVEAIRGVFDDSAIQADAFWRSARDEYCELRDRMRASVRVELSEEQNRTLDRLLAEYRAKKVAEPTAELEKSP